MTPPVHEQSEAERDYYSAINGRRASKRRNLYRNDPLWRLSKLKANWETRQRAKLRETR
jgi:hypothetical protein